MAMVASQPNRLTPQHIALYRSVGEKWTIYKVVRRRGAGYACGAA